MLPALLAPILSALASNGLGILSSAIQAKGKEVIEQKLGITIPDNASALTPEVISNLKIKEMEHEEFLISAQIEASKVSLQEQEAAYKDTEGARDREATIATAESAPLLNKIITPILAIGVIFLTFLFFLIVIFVDIPVASDKKDLLIYILGVLSAIATQVIAYYFGSSAGSKTKSEAIAALRKGL